MACAMKRLRGLVQGQGMATEEKLRGLTAMFEINLGSFRYPGWLSVPMAH